MTTTPEQLADDMDNGDMDYLHAVAAHECAPSTEEEMEASGRLLEWGLIRDSTRPDGSAMQQATPRGLAVIAAWGGIQIGMDNQLDDVLAFVEREMETAGLGDHPSVQQLLIDLEGSLQLGEGIHLSEARKATRLSQETKP